MPPKQPPGRFNSLQALIGAAGNPAMEGGPPVRDYRTIYYDSAQSRYVLDVLCVGQDDGELSLQYVPYRLPVDSDGFQSYMSHPKLTKPCSQIFQILSHRCEPPGSGLLSSRHRLQEATKLRSTAAVLPPVSLPKKVQLTRPSATQLPFAGKSINTISEFSRSRSNTTRLPSGVRSKLLVPRLSKSESGRVLPVIK